MAGKGDYGDWLKRHDVKRSSMDDLIRRYEDEATWAAQKPVLPDSGKTEQTAQEPETVSAISLTRTPHIEQRQPDPENDNRQKNLQVEISKREGVKPTHHKTILYLRQTHIDPEILGRYHAIQENDKKRVDSIMQRKISEGIDEVLALVPAGPSSGPEIILNPNTVEDKLPGSQESDEPTANAPGIPDVGTDVRSALRNLGFKAAEIKKVQLDPGLDFDEMMNRALQQLKPATAEKKVERVRSSAT